MRVSNERALWLARYVLPHEPALRAWLRRRRPAGLEIDDILQETYARLIAAASVADVRNPKAYAFQVAQSVLISHVRRSKVVSFLALADIDAGEVRSEEPSPEHQLADRDELQRLAEAIASLPRRVREVFALRRVEGLSQREVAERLGIAESTVEKHMSRGFQQLMILFSRGGNPGAGASSSGERKKRRSHGQANRS
jgi:RNA polymerase sigma-70 factor (ECF subfamily)